MIALIMVTVLHAWAKPPHYVFILPHDYVGWVQIIFGDPGAPPLPSKKHKLTVVVGESGMVRTRTIRTLFFTHDEFFYRTDDGRGEERLIHLPVDYVIDDHTHAGFDVGGTPDGSPGSTSWFFFIGPADMRTKIPWADITKVKGYGRPLQAPTVYPIPGRIHP
jgi:hypothetical protein